MSDIYVVQDGNRVVAASTKMQGAELIRADEATRQATAYLRSLPTVRDDKEYTIVHRYYYDNLSITNTELHDDHD